MRLRKEALLRKHWGSSGIKGGSLGTAKEGSLGTAKEGSLGTAKEGRCSLSCQRALTQKQTLWGGGALEVGDLCLFEDGRELAGALRSDVVAVETVRNGRGREDEIASVSAGPDTKANASESVRVPKQPTRATAASSCL